MKSSLARIPKPSADVSMIPFDFSNRVAIVTGAATGIGYALVQQLIAAGARVVLNDIDAESAISAAQMVDPGGDRCLPRPGDASDPRFIASLVTETVSRFARLDIAVANAGLTVFSTILDIAPESLRRMLDLNLQGSVFLAQAAARQMIAQGGGGRILFMSSVTGHQAHEGAVCYGMTKAALQMLAKGLVIELAPHGITTNAISPGAVVTERTVAGDPEYGAKWGEMTPTGNVSVPADIAAAALFLLSPAAAQITGQTLIVDGGWTATSPTPDFSH